MGKSISYQCWICPKCGDDHSVNSIDGARCLKGQFEYVINNYHNKPNWMLAQKIGKTEYQIKAIATKFKLKKSKDYKYLPRTSPLVNLDIEALKKFREVNTDKVTCEFFKISKSTLRNLVNQYDLPKNSEVVGDGRFKKGNIPFNKGKKQSEFMSEESIAKTKLTRFKKGTIPHNHKTVGSTRITKDGYIEIKVSEPRTWELLHRVVWKETHGPIPAGSNIQFKDKNPQNCNPENLYAITREKQMINNSINRFPEELKEVIRTLSKINKKIQKHGTK